MENRINIAELLRECPEGMELDCVLFDGVVFDEIDDDEYCGCSIVIKTKEGETWNLTSTGCWDDCPSAKCVIFPKGKTTWEGFVPPFKFKGGDVVYCKDESRRNQLFIIKEYRGNDRALCYLFLDTDGTLDTDECVYNIDGPATEEEKQKLFDAIKENGYKWNAETKTLEKIKPEFKVGDRIKRKGDTRLTTIKEVRDDCYIITIPDYFDNAYITDTLLFSNQNEYELVPNKFDITTLKPFDKVLVRNTNNERWRGQFYMSYDKNEEYPFECTYNCWMQCIPFEGNEYLLDKTDNCNDFYKIW